MQELEKILEEMRESSIMVATSKEHYIHPQDRRFVEEVVLLDDVEKIIRKHMNGGWIPVEERLPKAGEHVLVSFRSAGFLPATAIISENGRWSMLQGAKGFNDVTEDVIAWRPLPEPYRSANKTEASDWRKDMLRKFDRRD